MLQPLLNLISGLPIQAQCALLLVVGVALLLFGGHFLVLGAVAIARRLGVPVLLIGLTIVAAGTSAPELAFNLFAAFSDHAEMCFGNVIGSNIANIGLVLGLCAVYRPLVVHSTVVRRELPWLVGISAFMFLMAILPTSGLSSGSPTRGFGWIDGILFLLGFGWVLRVWYRQARSDARDPLVREVTEEAEAEKIRSLPLAIVAFIAGLALLWTGGDLTKEGAILAAQLLHFSDALIGLTVVAVATSLPEVAASLMAVRRGHTDLAVGNVVGSNLFNILLVLGVTSSGKAIPVPDLWGWYDLFFMFMITLALFPIARLGAKRNTVARGEGVLLLVFYVMYMTFGVLREQFAWKEVFDGWW